MPAAYSFNSRPVYVPSAHPVEEGYSLESECAISRHSTPEPAPEPEPEPALEPAPVSAGALRSAPQSRVRNPLKSVSVSDDGNDGSPPRSWSPPPFHGQRPSSLRSTSPQKLKAYAGKRRELLEILSSLHSTGIQQDLDLPQIVVIGSQSVGKSSLVESMSGIKLPRDTGTCTRCPTECRLQYSETWSCKVVLRFRVDVSGKSLATPRDVSFGPVLSEDDKDKVETRLRRAQKAILHPTMDPMAFLSDSDPDTSGYAEQTFSQNCVCIRVAGPDVPDLYFYDLPGIIANVSDGGNEGDIVLVEKLAKSFIQRPNCIVLLVISCETDFENQGAGRLVLKSQNHRNRTVGVLTKVDRIESGGQEKWVRILRNQDNPLPNGWFCVKQPDLPQLRSGISWENAKAAEAVFFEETSPWSQLDPEIRERLGSAALAEQLGKILSELVAQKLPIIDEDITRQLRIVNAELLKLPPPNSKDPKALVVGLFRDFERKLSKHMEGLPEIHDADNITSGIIYEIHNTFERFKDDVRRTAPRFCPWDSKVAIARDVLRGLQTAADNLDIDMGQTDSKAWYLDQVMSLAKKCRTTELPGHYPFAATRKLIARYTENWESLAIRYFEEVEVLVSDHVMDLVKLHFKKHAHGGLKDVVIAVTAEHLRQRFQTTLDKVKSVCANEVAPYTMNDHYFFSNRSNFLGQYKTIYRQSQGHKALLNTLQNYGVRSSDWGEEVVGYPPDINGVMAGLAQMGIPGLKATEIAKLLPEDEMTPGLEIMAEVKAYFKVAYKRFVDNIPQQINTVFIQGLDDDLGLVLAEMDLTQDQCAIWIQEDPSEKLKREDLLGRKKRLELAKEKIGSVVRTAS
ncbi:hypothetical protein FRB94_010068 [Tulasnella sp. JGI-2019a]|nr:hypothetical protein FRB93_003927 [Tulasnella sp. JGI-2019a]KAG8994197.1 hypothetical protein FRB94_010068 [Tulasnella sp. JGI-2019a]KAG9033667.1 hypothetical protein FRB95_014555 [Tulasnella sp. JGI-2019a]